MRLLGHSVPKGCQDDATRILTDSSMKAKHETSLVKDRETYPELISSLRRKKAHYSRGYANPRQVGFGLPYREKPQSAVPGLGPLLVQEGTGPALQVCSSLLAVLIPFLTASPIYPSEVSLHCWI